MVFLRVVPEERIMSLLQVATKAMLEPFMDLRESGFTASQKVNGTWKYFPE